MLIIKKFIKNNVVFLIISFILITLVLRDFYIKNEVNELNKFTIAKFTLKNDLPKRTNFYFTYILNGVKITTAKSGINYSILNSERETKIIDNLQINYFYLAKYNPEHPQTIIVDPLKRITDTTEILKAGFSKEDIKK
jgi:hypothetical protein